MGVATRAAEQGPREAWGCEREQGAGSTGADRGGERCESLAAIGTDSVIDDYTAVVQHVAIGRQAAGDRRVAAGRRRDEVLILPGFTEPAGRSLRYVTAARASQTMEVRRGH